MHEVALLLRRQLTLRVASGQRLLWIHAGGEILLLLQALCHALKHVWLNLSHLLHVAFLLPALFLTGNRVE